MGGIISLIKRCRKEEEPKEEVEQLPIENDASPSLPAQLCGACSQLDLEAMLQHETEEQAIGFLTDYLDADCPFCSLICQSVRIAWGDDWSTSRVCCETNASIRVFIRSQSPLSARIHGRMEHPEPRILLAIDQKPPTFQRNRATLRQLDRGKSRFIIAEIEHLPETVPSSAAANFLPRREVSQRIDVGLIQSWLSECRNHKHPRQLPSLGSESLFHEDHPFRLIDVVDECLVLKSSRCEYAALSYVWGRIPTLLSPGNNEKEIPILLTTRENVSRCSAPRSLSQAQPVSRTTGRIPRTVRDAMEMTRQIGMRYLWVDTLCIIQDDPEDKARIIEQMADVYDNATVTLVAAAGSDADAGLSGISPRTGQPLSPAQITNSTSGTTLNLSLCLPSLCDEIRRATWNTRGWTFQEQSLSQRCLYLTPAELFFNCSEAQWREGYNYSEEARSDGIALEIRTGPPWWNRNLRKDPDPTPYHYLGHGSQGLNSMGYQKAVQDYSRRNLTYQQDILSAYEGIFHRFQQLSNAPELSIRDTQSIPTQFMHLALLWFPGDGCERRLVEESEKFATWSWVSWIGPIEFVFAESLWLSRNISHGVIKRAPLYTAITAWYFGDTTHKVWSHDLWKTASENQDQDQDPDPPNANSKTDELSHTTAFLTKIGLNVPRLLNYPPPPPQPTHNDHATPLGFHAAYLPSTKFTLSAQTAKTTAPSPIDARDRDSKLSISSTHTGKFRFDGPATRVDELVPVVAGNTITKVPDTYTIFLGLVTEDGGSRRVGVGYVYYSRDGNGDGERDDDDDIDTDGDRLRPRWEYKFFWVQ